MRGVRYYDSLWGLEDLGRGISIAWWGKEARKTCAEKITITGMGEGSFLEEARLSLESP